MLQSDFWDKYFRVYDILNTIGPYQKLMEEIINESDIEPGHVVLDAGVGTGNLAVRLHEKGARVIGIDFSPEAIAIYRSKKNDAEVFLADLTEELHMFKNDSFDRIVSNNVLYNIPRSKRLSVACELRRVLKPGGKVVLSNIHHQFKPLTVYREAIRHHFERFGGFNTLIYTLRMALPTIKIFYYNFQVNKKHKNLDQNLFLKDEQRQLLTDAGFENVSPTRYVYAEQAIINSAYKN